MSDALRDVVAEQVRQLIEPDRRAALRALAAAHVRQILDIDDDPIGELDDDTLILLQALHELDEESGHEGRAFNPALHKRWPKGHPKAGKFRPMVDILKLAIAHFDPAKDKHPFENFKREQLLKAAKTRGITLKKGEDRDSIAAKLLADLGGKLAKPEPAKKAAAKATKAKTGNVSDVLAGDFSSFKKVGAGAGTTPAGVYEAPDGSRWYVKAQKSEVHAKNEALASALYRAADIDAPEVVRGSGTPGLTGKDHTATRLVDAPVANLGLHVANGNEPYLAQIRQGFAVDAWLANWDVVGEGSEHPWGNIVQGADGKPHRIDVGGAILFRGKGGEKGDRFGPQVVEFDTMRDLSKGRRHSQVFAGITDDELAVSVGRVKAVTPAKIRKLVADHGMDPDLADLLIARRKDLLSRAGAAKKVSKPSKESKGWAGAATGVSALEAAPVRIEGTAKTRGLLQTLGLKPDTAQWAHLGFEAYQDGGYGTFNKGLLKYEGAKLDTAGDHFDSEDIEKIEAMDKAMEVSRLTDDVIVFRGERAPARNFPPGMWSLTGGMEGMEWTFHPFGSSSADMDVALDFAIGPTSAPKDQAQPTVLRILVPKGTQAVHLKGSLESEQELLLARSLKYRVVKDEGVDVDGVRRIDVEVVPA